MTSLRLDRIAANADLVDALAGIEDLSAARSVLHAFRIAELREPTSSDAKLLRSAREIFRKQFSTSMLREFRDLVPLTEAWAEFCALRYLDLYLLAGNKSDRDLLANTAYIEELRQEVETGGRVILVPFHLYQSELVAPLLGRFAPISQLVISAAKAESVLGQGLFPESDMRFIETSSAASLLAAERAGASGRLVALALDVYSGSRRGASTVDFLGGRVLAGGRGFSFLSRVPGTRIVVCSLQFSSDAGRYCLNVHVDRRTDGSSASLSGILVEAFAHLDGLVNASPHEWYGWERLDQLKCADGEVLESGVLAVPGS